MWVVRVDHMVRDSMLGLTLCFFFLQAHQLASDGAAGFATPALYNLAKLCKLLKYIECKKSKWTYKEGGGGEYFQRRKVQIACLDIDKIKRGGRGIMV